MLGCVLTLPTFLGRQMVARRTLGGLGGIVQTAPTFKDQAGRVGGPRQAPERDPTARMLLSCINKQQQLLRCLRLPPPLPPSPYFPLEDPRPVKFSLATTANKAQSLCALNCEWHRQNAPSLLHGSLSARTPPLLVVGGDPTGCLHMYNL